jgi:hypothetical protein
MSPVIRNGDGRRDAEGAGYEAPAHRPTSPETTLRTTIRPASDSLELVLYRFGLLLFKLDRADAFNCK